ncbi:hypothetical protein LSP03_43200 [Lysinibacillus sphaericus]|nr:hypothetical protein LSP03_43200 [Lysinibacillus sphaericus]
MIQLDLRETRSSVTDSESLFYYLENYVNIVPKLSSNSIVWRIFFMTNKTGLFDVDFSLSTKELTTQGGYAMLRNLSAFDKM